MLRKILIGIFIISVIPGIFWGITTGDSRKGAEVYVNTFNYLSQPVKNYLTGRLERSQERAIKRAEKLQENYSQNLDNQ